MDKKTISTITAVLGMVNPAMGVISAFVSALGGDSSKVVKVTGAVQDAANVVTAFAPLIDQFVRGEELDLEDARASLVSRNIATAGFDAMIASKGG